MKYNKKAYISYKHNNIVKKLSILIFTFLWVIGTSISYANIEDDEIIDINSIKKETVETATKVAEEPDLNARIGLIFDRSSKTILYEKNGLKQVPMASTTKIMTSIIVLEQANLTDIVTVDKKAAGTGGSRLGLKVNDKITVHDLLYGLMLKSGNDAAVALAVHIGGSVEGFAKLMNEKAKKIGWINSHFISPHGLDADEHYTTAYELACMSDYALEIPKFREIVQTKNYYVTINGQSKLISNTNELLGNLNGVYGIKTGFTNGAGRCLVTACKRDNLDIITVVLGADTKKIRTSDSIKLIEYAYKNYEVINLKEIVEEQFEKWKQLNNKRIYINKGRTNKVEFKMEELTYPKIAVKKNEKDNVTTEFKSLYYIEAPIDKNEIIGNVKIRIKDNTIYTLNILLAEAIEKKDICDYFMQFLTLVP